MYKSNSLRQIENSKSGYIANINVFNINGSTIIGKCRTILENT